MLNPKIIIFLPSTNHIQIDNGISTSTLENGNCIEHEALINIKIECHINNKWYCSIENTGSVSITRYDYGNIFSGVFNCKMANRDDPTNIIEITDGRFDIKWLTLLDTSFP